MLSHYLLTLYRSLTRHRLYAALNVLGLAVGIAVFLVLMLDVRFEMGFERWIPDARSIYLVRSDFVDLGLKAHATMGGTLDELKADFPQLVGTRVWDQPATVRQDGRVTPEQVEVVDPGFFRVFDLPLAAGDKATALGAPDNLVLTQAQARRYFGPADPIGQSLTLAFDGAVHAYKVAAVLKDLPKDTDLKLDFIVPLTPQLVAGEHQYWWHWGSLEVATYLRLANPRVAAALQADLAAFVDRHARQDVGPAPHKHLQLRLAPLTSHHLHNPKDAAVVAALGAVGLLTLLLAMVNYINLATARAALRAREAALRKVMGATGPMLVAQFICEALATAFLAGLIGLALCELALPAVNAAGGLSLAIDYFGPRSILPVIIAVIALVGVGAGAWPALLLSRFQPAAVLAAVRTPGGGRAAGRVREALVVFQFAIAIAFIIATAVIAAQTRYVRHADLGFRRQGLIVVSSFDDSEVTGPQRASLLDLWRATPGIVDATAADIAPGNEDMNNATNTKRPGTPGDGPAVYYVMTQPDFFATYGARLIVGRILDGRRAADDSRPYPDAAAIARDPVLSKVPTPPRNVVLNASALPVLGFRNARAAIGKTIETEANDHSYRLMTVVGVIDDIRFRSPRQPVPPTFYMMRTQDVPSEVAGVRYAGVDPRALLRRMAAQWREVAPTVPFRAKTAEDNLQAYYRPVDQRARLFTAGAVLAVAIGCLGLYGLASFTTARRVREIGIRKALGASTSDILRLLIGQFLRPVLLANLVAWPLAYFAMRSWLSGFDQRIGLSPGYFLAAAALTLVIALATVAAQAIAVARSEPAKALRHE